MIFHLNRLLADDSHETSYFIFLKIGKHVEKLTSAAVVIGALRVNIGSIQHFMAKNIDRKSLDILVTIAVHLYNTDKQIQNINMYIQEKLSNTVLKSLD